MRGGGKFIEPERYISARLPLKEGEITAGFHLPGRSAPRLPVAAPCPARPRPRPPHRRAQRGPAARRQPGRRTTYNAGRDIAVHRDNTYRDVRFESKGGGE